MAVRQLAPFSVTLFCISSRRDGAQDAVTKHLRAFVFLMRRRDDHSGLEVLFKLEQCLGKVLTTLSWEGWETKPSEILIGIHSLLCCFPKQVLGTVALFLEMRIWN